MSTPIENRYDFVLLFDVKDGNPNGDPDAGNLPRLDPETGEGLVTDVAIKRKIRNYVGLVKGEEPGYEIYVREKAVLNRAHQRGYEGIGEESVPKKLPKDEAKARELTAWMCKNFFDIRTFGAVMTTDVNAGQVRGPVQLTFARSVGPVVPAEHSITRMAVTNERDLEKERTIGRKFTIRYGLYRGHGFISPAFAKQSGFSEDDLALFWDAIQNMFEHDRSAVRGQMAVRGLYVFKHDSPLGRAPAHQLLDLVSVEQTGSPAKGLEDFSLDVDEGSVPEGVELIRMVG
jgi:CRISPR-associated protein Csd2